MRCLVKGCLASSISLPKPSPSPPYGTEVTVILVPMYKTFFNYHSVNVLRRYLAFIRYSLHFINVVLWQIAKQTNT